MFKQLSRLDVTSLVLRWGLAVIFITRGVLKLRHGWGTAWEVGVLPASTQAVVAWGELLGGAALALGLLSRVAAVGLGLLMAVGGYVVYYQTGDKFAGPVWGGDTPVGDSLSVGPEYNFALFALCLGVVILGGGLLSLDHYLAPLWKRCAARTAIRPHGAPALPRA
jgi:putative oxidoreductase